MLEELLWQLGNTPENEDVKSKKPRERLGYLANRIEHNNRKIFTTGCEFSACKDVSKKSIQEKTIERLVWGFKNANEIDGSYGVSRIIDDYTPNNNNVTQNVLDVLKKQWEHYLSATDIYEVKTLNSKYKLKPLNSIAGSYDSWIKQAVAEWDGTYSKTVNANIAMLTATPGLTREGLLKGWIPIEAGPNTTHWGLTPDNYRMIGGAADRRMSLGFTQIQSRYIYGLDKRTRACIVLDGKNYMSPKNNVAGLPIWSANRGCGESFSRAFSGLYNNVFPNSGNEKIIRAKYGSNNTVLLVTASTTVDFVDGDYERLTKGIAGYNQGGTTNSDWGSSSLPGMLKNLTKAASCGYNNKGEETNLKRCKGLSYAIHVKEAAGIPLANYIWRVVKTNPNPALNKNICFEYGETHWRNNYSWDFVKNKALLNQPLATGGPSVKISCPVSP